MADYGFDGPPPVLEQAPDGAPKPWYRNRVLLALWDTFKENGIHIPYPHREIIVKDGVATGLKGNWAAR